MLTYYGNGKTKMKEYDRNDRNIGLFGLEKKEIIQDALFKDIIIIKKWNIKRIIYIFNSEKIG